MSATQITYTNKVSVTTSTLPEYNQVMASDMNQIKTAVNNNAVIIDQNTENQATLYSSTSTYKEGSYCLYDNVFYVCNADITTAEAWNSAHWTQTTIGDSIQNGGGAGHTIVDASGTDMPQEKKLQFTGTGVTSVTDDATNGKTIVTVSGEKGDAATVTVGTTTTGAAGTSASVTNSGTTSAAVLNFKIPQGNKGDTGNAATVSVGTTTTLDAGSNATVSNSGTTSAAILDFGIPKGSQGDAATVSVGTVTTLPAGSSATVTNSGTTGAAVFNFGIPKGKDGTGSGTITGVSTTSPLSGGGTSGSVTVSHATSGVTAGIYKSVSVNDTGHVIGGTNPTTLSGYGITDANISSGVITLGADSITPLTSSSTLDATKLSGTASISTTGNASTATSAITATTATNATTAAGYTANGGIATALAGKQASLTFDTAPTSGSTNPVTSGGILTAINNATARTSVDITLSASAWSSSSYTISNSAITSTTDQFISFQSGATAAQITAFGTAQIVASQTTGSIVLTAKGTVPAVDIPITLVIRA